MRVAMVGGGVGGLAVAQRLASAGAEVVVVERDVCGRAASHGNAGWVTPILSVPLSGPGVLTKSLRWMIDPKSPLLIRPRLDPSFLLWCLRFARNCTETRFEQSTRALLALNATTLDAYDRLEADGVRFEMHDDGLLLAALDQHELEKEWKLCTWLTRLGYGGDLELLDRSALRLREPTISDAVTGAIYARTERHVRPETLTAGLAEWLRQTGAEIVEHTAVERILPARQGWIVQASGPDRIEADRIVVASGVWSKSLLRQLGAKIPLEGAKGYSVTLDARGAVPRHPVGLLEAKVAVSPFNGSLRIAGTLELAGESQKLDARRISAIIDAVGRYMTCDVGSAGKEWAGLRPVLPDSLPVIGPVPGADGVFVATGHATLGVTLAPATAEALAPLVLNDELHPALAPLRANRRY
jgi:D-amino-acid dehydrogenase